MRSALWAIGAAALAAACAPLKSDPLPPVAPPEFGTVSARRETEIKSGESAGERALWGALSLNPLVIAGAVLAAQDDYGRVRVNEYDIALTDGRNVTVRSRYLAEPGQCVMMRATAGGFVVLIRQSDASCPRAPETDTPSPPAEGEAVPSPGAAPGN